MNGLEYMNKICPTTSQGKDPNREDVADAFDDGYAMGYEQAEKNKQKKEFECLTIGDVKKIYENLLSCQNINKIEWTKEDSRAIDNCCLLIGVADECYEKAFKDECIHYLQNLKQRMEQ